MKEADKELLSRILDEDLSEFETQRILKEMRSDHNLATTLQRYDVIGHALRREIPKKYDQKFVQNVIAQLENEEMEFSDIETQNDDQQEQTGKFKATIGLAIAASVAIFSFVAFQNIFQPEQNTQPDAIVAQQQKMGSEGIERVSSEDLQNFITNPKAAASFNSYIMNHAEYASPRVSVPHVRIVGYGKDGLEDKQ